MSLHMELGAATSPARIKIAFSDKQLQATMQCLRTRPCAGFIISVAHRGRNPLETQDARACIILSGQKARRADWRSHSRPGTKE